MSCEETTKRGTKLDGMDKMKRGFSKIVWFTCLIKPCGRKLNQ